uniref:GLOBIN domain-containing protein n=1 Tax=Rhodnius prolixus TaxID=13249 RepID=T1HWR1_RHOPR
MKGNCKNFLRQMAVLTRYTPKDHANIDVMDRRRRGLRKLARINKSYYGNAPTFWKCKRLDDIWYTDGVINEYKCIEEPCICPKKSEDEINKKKRELSHPTFISLTQNEKELLKDSWKKRGINKSTLAMMWFTKLFKANPEELLKHNHGQILEELFMDQTNLDYMDKLAEIFSIVVQNIDKSTLCTKLIWELAMYHRCLDLTESYFQLLKKTLLDTLIENFHPSLTPEQIEAWKKFIGIMFDIIYDIFLWDSWPLPERTSLKKRQELEKDLESSSSLTICSDDLLFPLSEHKEEYYKEDELELEEQSDTVEEQEQEAESFDHILVLYPENVSIEG